MSNNLKFIVAANAMIAVLQGNIINEILVGVNQ
jgi:hypothetical protein